MLLLLGHRATSTMDHKLQVNQLLWLALDLPNSVIWSSFRELILTSQKRMPDGSFRSTTLNHPVVPTCITYPLILISLVKSLH